MAAIGWRKRGGSKPLKFTKEKHMSNETEKQEPVCPHIYEPLGCYRVRCQLGRKCVDAQSQPKREWVSLTEDEAIELLPVGNWEIESTLYFAKAIEAKLREKNGK